MKTLIIALVIVVMLLLIGAAMSVRVVKQYEPGVLFRLGKVLGARTPGLRIEDGNRHRRARYFLVGEKAAVGLPAAPPGAVMRAPVAAANGATDAS